MSSSSIVANPSCTHHHHWFAHPLCEQQSAVQRIANIAFHILTLGIPLAIYHVISCCYSRITARQQNENLQAIAIRSVLLSKNAKPYTPLGQEALQFARSQWKEHPEIAPTPFTAGRYSPKQTYQPINQEIPYLNTLYLDAIKKFKELLKQNKEDPWNTQEVIDAADACMKIGYAISNLTLDELEPFTQDLASKGEERTYAKALCQQDAYPYRTFYYCTNIYHWLRGGITWGVRHRANDQEGLLFPAPPIPEAHAASFYQEGTLQNSWNELYNEYCDRIRLYVDEKELKSADNRHSTWTQKDTGVDKFTAVPDTQPT